MATQVRWSEKASSHLQHIYDYIASDSPYYAERFITRLINSVERQLSNQPLSGRKAPELSGKCQSFLKEVVFKGYRIIYNPAKAPVSVTIVAVLSSKMHIPKQIRKRWELE